MSFRLTDIEFFVRLVEATKSGRQSWKEVAALIRENPLVLQKRSRPTRDNSAFRKWLNDLDVHFKRPLVVRRGKSIGETTPAGEQLFRITAPVIPLFQLMWTHPKLAIAPVLTIGTANTFEVHLVARRLIAKWNHWLEESANRRKLVHLRVKEAKSRFEGLDNVESGEWQVFLDGIQESTGCPAGLKVEALGGELGLVVVAPTAIVSKLGDSSRLAFNRALTEGKGLTISDLRDCPLCFVDVMGLGDRIAATAHQQPRVALASNEAARVVASQGQMVTICAAWTKTLPSDFRDSQKYVIAPLQERRCVTKLVAIYRNEPPPPPLIMTFVDWLKEAVQEEATGTDIQGHRTGFLEVPDFPSDDVSGLDAGKRAPRRKRNKSRKAKKATRKKS